MAPKCRFSQAYDHFTLDPEGTFTIYDRAWNALSNCSVGAFRPSNLAQFEMAPVAAVSSQSFAAGGGGGSGGASASSAPWLEVGVAGATETVPNPAPEYATGGQQYAAAAVEGGSL
jgi:hypothetical protein